MRPDDLEADRNQGADASMMSIPGVREVRIPDHS
jgi:hypothetical protein